MQVKVSEAKAQLSDLVRRAEAGEEVILTRHGRPVVRLVPVAAAVDRCDVIAISAASLTEALIASGGRKPENVAVLTAPGRLT